MCGYIVIKRTLACNSNAAEKLKNTLKIHNITFGLHCCALWWACRTGFIPVLPTALRIQFNIRVNTASSGWKCLAKCLTGLDKMILNHSLNHIWFNIQLTYEHTSFALFVCFGFFLQTWIYLVRAEFWTASSQVTVREVNTIISHLKSSWGISLINISLKKHFMIRNTKDLSQELCNLFLAKQADGNGYRCFKTSQWCTKNQRDHKLEQQRDSFYHKQARHSLQYFGQRNHWFQ